MSTNAGATEQPTSDAVVSSEPPINSNTVVSNGVTVVVGADSLASRTETLTTELVDDSRVSGGEIGDVMDNDEKVGGDIVVQGSVDEARVCVDQIGTVMNESELVLDKSTSDAGVSAEPLSNRDVDAVDGVKVGAESLGSETETLTTKPSDDHNRDGDIVVRDSVDDARVSVDEIGTVMNNSEVVLDKSTSDAVVSSEPLSNRDVDTVDGVKIGDDSLGSKTETLTMKSSDDRDGGADTVVQDSIDDEKRIVMNKSEVAFGKSISDAVVSSEPLSNRDGDSVDGVKIRDDSLGLKTETITVKASADHNGGADTAVQDSIDDGKGIVMNNGELVMEKLISDAVVSSEPLSDRDVDTVDGVKIGDDSLGSKTETLTVNASDDRNGDGDTVVQDSIDDSRASRDEKGIVMNKSELVLDKSTSYAVVSSVTLSKRDIDAVDGVKTGADALGLKTETLTMKPSDDYNGGVDTVVQDSVDDSTVSGYEKGIVMNKSELASDKSITDVVVSSVPPSNRDVDTVDGVKIGDDSLGSKTETLTVKPSTDHNGDDDIVVQDSVDDSRVSREEKGVVMENIEKVPDENEVIYEEKEGEYKVTDIVWAKVKNYPWWPGQIFDPSSATDKAKKFSNKKGHLGGYFGDQSFAWNKPPNIKPFRKNFRKLEKQSNSKGFFHAVNCALDEVSRRVEFGLACSCLSKEVYDKVKSQVFVNAGIREEDSKIDGGDRFSTVSTFKPVKVVQSVQELAREHFDGFSRLEVLSVRSQLLAFFRWKGYYQLQAQSILDGPDNKLEAESELPLTEENKEVEDEKLASLSKKASSKKRKPDVCDSDDSVPFKKERSLKNVTPKGSSSAKTSSKKRKPDVCDSDDSVPRKKERSLTNVTPKGTSSAKRSKKDISKKATVEDDVMEENGNEKPDSAGKKVSSKKRKPDDCDSDDSVPRKKERSLTKMTSKGSSSVKRSKNSISKKANLKDEENGNGTGNKKSSISSPKMFRIGDSICKIAKQISKSPSILKKESDKSKNDENSATLKKTAKKDGQPVEADQTEE